MRGYRFGKDNLTAAEVAQLTGLSVHTLSYWRQSGQGPKTIKAGTRTLYRRKDVEQWLAEVDGRSEPMGSSRNVRSESTLMTTGWYEKAVEAAGRIEPAHTSPWKLASTYALLSIAESLLTQHQPRRPGPDPAGPVGQKHGELLTVAEVAEMTRLSVSTLRWWRSAGAGGPESIKLGRRVMYRRADVEKWLEEAR
jgi:excisionase family DNA binding protein